MNEHRAKSNSAAINELFTDVTHVHQLFFKASEQFKDKVALVAKGGEGKSYTYQEICSSSKALANKLLVNGPLQKKEIGLISENRPEWVIAYFAILSAGGTVVPIDANLKPNEISYVINHAELDSVFCSGKFESILAGIGRKLKIYSMEEESQDYFLKDIDPQLPYQFVNDNEIALLIYTSGTTGDPKAVELTHTNLIANMYGIKLAIDFNETRIFLSLLPLHHTFEGTCGFLSPMISGSKIVYARSLKSKEIVEDIKKNKVTCMCGVPLLYEKIHHSFLKAISSAPTTRKILFKVLYGITKVGWKLKKRWGERIFSSLRDKSGLGSIEFFVSGGAALPTEISKFFNLIGFKMIEGYGMTECSPAIAFTRLDDIKFGSVGRPLSNVEVKIDKPDEFGIGEILVQGESVTPGYRGNKEQTDKLIRDGWLYTGDLGKIEKDNLYITGRAKNLIVSAAGKNIYPEEIEEKLLGSTLILEAVVFGRSKKDKQGEDVCAIVVPMIDEFVLHHGLSAKNPDMNVIHKVLEQVVKDVNAEMSNYKRINMFDIQLEELEKTSTKKVKRFVYK